MRSNRKLIGAGLGILATAVAFVLGITTINESLTSAFYQQRIGNGYSLTLNSANKVTSAGDHDQFTAIGNKVTFTYTSVASSTSGHVTLNNTGTLANKNWMRSITAFTATFETTSSLTAKLSFGGDVWNDGFTLESGHKYELGSNPYYVKFISSGVTTVSSVVFEYSCTINPNAHEGEEGGEGLLGVIDFWNINNVSDGQTSTLVNLDYVSARSYDSDNTSTRQAKTLVSSVNAEAAYQKRYGGIGLTKGSGSGTLTLTLAEGISPTSVTVIAGSQNPTKTLYLNDASKSVSANCSSITALNDTYTNTLTWTFDSAPEELEFYAPTNGSKIAIFRIYLTGTTGPSWDKPKDLLGFTATDSKKDDYKMTDIFDNANGLSVVANYSDGSTETLSKGGSNGYSYVVTDINGYTIDTSSDFGNIGGNNKQSFTVTVSYKDLIPQEYVITVSFVTKLTGITVNSDYLEFTTAQKLSDFTSGVSVDLAYNKTTLNETDVGYDLFSDRELTLTLLDPNGVTHSISSAFGTAGTWTIKVTSNNDSSIFGQLNITVNAIPVETITVTGAGGVTTLQEDAKLQLTAAVQPNNATTQAVTWSSGNTSVAIVNNNGLVTGVSAGNVRITATSTDGSEVFGFIDLVVTEKPPVVITTVDDELTNSNTIGETTTSYSSWTCTSTNAEYAGQSAGSNGTIQLRTNNSNSGIVSTTSAGYISKVSVNWNGGTTEGRTLNVYGSNSAYSDPTDLYSSNNQGTLLGTIVYGTSTELTISGSYTFVGVRSNGSALYMNGITFTWSNQQAAPADPVYPTGISLSGTSTISINGTSQLAVTYTPQNTTVKNVSFSSNKTSIATVSETGLVTGIAAGTARITATAQTNNSGGTTTAYIDITVQAIAVSSVELNKTATTITVGNTEQLTATISPSNAGNKNVTWSLSNVSPAGCITISNTGLVTAVSAGSATVTVTTVDGCKTSSCTVTAVASGGGSGSSGTATIAVTDIPKTYNTSAGNTSASDYTFTVNNVASSYTSGAMQWKKSSGYIENTEPIEGLLNITIGTFSGKTFSGTLYSGTSQSPSSNSQAVSNGHTYTFAANTSYFKLEVGSATGYTGDISLAYSTTPIDPTSISISPSSAEVSAGGSKDLTVNYTPSGANQHKDVTWSRYSGSSNITVSSSGTVSVSSNASAGQTAVIRATLDYNSSIYASCTITVVEKQQDDQTILIYMCGSDLESDGQTNSSKASGYATGDITEILSVKNQPDNVNVVLETGGAKCWKSTYGISANYLTRFHIANKSLVQDSQISKANMGLQSTLQSFVTWGLQTYPADRVSLILWNHGGAMRGVCYDENYSSDSLSNSEIKNAIAGAFTTLGRSSSDKLEWIGYDACLMQVQDIAEFNSQYFKYMVGSEESEAGDGWDYDTWLDDAYANKATETILSAIVDGFISATNIQYQQNGWGASDQTLSWLDLSYMSAYKSAWETMASALKPLISNKSTFQTMMKTVKYYGSDSDCEGYSYFGIFDAKDTLNKLKTNYSSISAQITNALNAFANLVKYSKKGSGAGNSNGLCCFFPMKDGSGYTCNTSSVYTSSQTNFTNWRSIVTSYGD